MQQKTRNAASVTSAKYADSRAGRYLTLEDTLLEPLGHLLGWGAKGGKQQGVR